MSHWKVLERVEGPYGKFTLLEVRIETGRTHQIRRAHAWRSGIRWWVIFCMERRIGFGVVEGEKKGSSAGDGEEDGLSLERNFLHAAALEFAHPRTGEMLSLEAELPEELGGIAGAASGVEA